MPDKMNNDINNYEEAWNERSMFRRFLAFSEFWLDAFITSEYIIYTGNFESADLELMYRFQEKVEKHPILWKIFRHIFGV
jgi:hypothetical protein